ncbi:DEKNAAC100834 [Brettanomyces naardenensis]|uniref:DEKNAAC100834 n=1 Tax=Brettanomyces naardenensis TaxID=13370 RepID=A0A448YFT3_BRENA|nr:DEKNAAC100834 [Brettanomyces naardenensis]
MSEKGKQTPCTYTIEDEIPDEKDIASHTPLLQIVTGKSYNAFAHEDEDKFPDGGIRAWTVVLGSAVGLMTVFGVMQTISSIQVYIQNNMLKDVKVSATSWIFSIYMFSNLSMGIVAGPLFDIYGVRKVLLPGMILNCAGLYATAFSTKLWHFILSFGFASGIGSGLMMNPLMSVISHWFLRRRGVANGFSQAGSVTGVIFPILLRSLYPTIGYRNTMCILASICVSLCIICFLLVQDRRRILADDEVINSGSLLRKIGDVLDFRSLKEKQFSLLVAGLFFNEFSLLLVITYLGTYAEARGMSESDSYVLVTVMNSAGVIGKIVPNYFSDKVGRFNVMVLVSASMAISIFALWLPYYNRAALYAFACIYGFSFAGSYAMTPVTVSQISLTRQFGSRFATAYFIVAFGNLISMPIGSQFINAQTVRSYNNMIIFAGCTTLLATTFFVLSRTAIVGKRLWKFV